MLSVQDVLDVARTGESHEVQDGVTLTIEDVVKLTSPKDWDGILYELTPKAALEIGAQFNARHGLGPMPAIEPADEAEVLIGDLLELEAA